MIYQILAVCVVSAIAGIKKPIYGGLAGATLSPIVYLLFYEFDSFLFAIIIPIGFAIGISLGGALNFLFSAVLHDENRRPYYTSMHVTGSSMGSGIVYTDEEEKNAEQNEDKLEE